MSDAPSRAPAVPGSAVPLTRRAALLLSGLGLVGCAAPSEAPNARRGSGAPKEFPVVVTHAQGTITLHTPARRIVTLGHVDTQIARALEAPIVGAVRSPFPDGNWPGVRPPLEAATLDLPEAAPDLERIAAHRPDLILASSCAEEFLPAYDELSRIAPVFSHQDPRLGGTRTQLIRTIGALVGARDRAEELLRRSAAAMDAFAAAHPELTGRTVVFGRSRDGATEVFTAADSPPLAFLARLGLRPLPLPALLRATGASGLARLGPDEATVLEGADFILLRPDASGEVPGLPVEIGSRVVRLDAAATVLLADPHPAVTFAALQALGAAATRSRT